MRYSAAFSLTCFVAAGCAVPLTGTDLTLEDFEMADGTGTCSTTSDCAVDVTSAPATIECELTITTTGDAALDAGCVFISPNGRKTSCLAHTPVGTQTVITITMEYTED